MEDDNWRRCFVVVDERMSIFEKRKLRGGAEIQAERWLDEHTRASEWVEREVSLMVQRKSEELEEAELEKGWVQAELEQVE